MAKTCKKCGGTYEPVQRDGTNYYHVCPDPKPKPTKKKK